MTSLLTDISGSLSAFAGAASDDWAIARAARQWGIFYPPDPNAPAPKQPVWRQVAARVVGDELANVFSKGPKKVLSAAHVESLDLAERSSISTAPQEEGQFTSYNKVFEPYQGVVRFICDGSETGNIGENLLPGFVRGLLGDGQDKIRKDFMATLALLVKDTNLYFIATPERIYKRANIVGYRVNRKSDAGIDMIVVDVQVQEVRQSKRSGYLGAKNPQGAQVQDNGPVNLAPAPVAQAAGAITSAPQVGGQSIW